MNSCDPFRNQGPQATRQETRSSAKPMAPILVVSTGRTGTVSIAENFHIHYPFITAVHEPFGSRILRILGNLYVAGNINDRITSSAIRLTHGFRRARNRNRLLMESNPHVCCLLPAICRMYPDTVVVHVVRHPADFIRSYINHGAFNGLKGILGHRIPYWFLRPEHVNDPDWPAWNKMSPMEASAWRWSILNYVIERDCERWASHHFRVRHEDLFSDGPEEWMRISIAMGLDPRPWESETGLVHANASRLSVAPATDEWSDELKKILERRCLRQMERYGYSLQ